MLEYVGSCVSRGEQSLVTRPKNEETGEDNFILGNSGRSTIPRMHILQFRTIHDGRIRLGKLNPTKPV